MRRYCSQARVETLSNVGRVNPYGGPDEADSLEAAPQHPQRSHFRLALAIAAVCLLAVTAVAAVEIALSMSRLVTEQKRETCYARLAFLDGASDFNRNMPEYNTLKGRSSHAHSCDGDHPLTQFDRR